MTEMTNAARERLEEYLRQVESALTAASGVDVDEVVADVREHVEAELSGVERPARLEDLETVLERLGRPEGWVPEEELGMFRRTIARLQHGPEDWRLAYLAFVLFVVGFLAFEWLGGLVIVSFLLARPALSLAERRGGGLGERAWLVYPSLLFVYFVVAVGLFLGPGAGAPAFYAPGGLVREVGRYVTLSLPVRESVDYLLLVGGTGTLVLGLWWTLLGTVFGRRPSWMRALFRPFADGFEARHAVWLRRIGLLLAVVGAVTLAVLVP